MKTATFLLLALISYNVFPATKKSDQKPITLSPEIACKSLVVATIKSTALLMGFKDQFEVELSDGANIGRARAGAPLKSYSSSQFIVGDGYIMGSGASAVVLDGGSTCEIIKLSVTLEN